MHEVTAYATEVVAGRSVAGRLVRLACDRHLRDLETGPARGLTFDENLASHVVDFCETYLCHYQGEWAGQSLLLEPWQKFILGSLFGWTKANGKRRFRRAYIELGRKNGKSLLASAAALYLLIADKEGGAQVYSAATKRDQARIVFDAAAQMVRRSSKLRAHVQVLQHNISVAATGSKFEPLSADSKTMDGLNVHGAILDELHAHPNRGVVDVIDTAVGARLQPMIIEITTAGDDRHSICWEHRTYCEQILAGTFADESADSWFGYIAAIDDGDSWTDETTWAKANPNLGVSVKLDYLRRRCEEAKANPGAQAVFRQKHLDEWVSIVKRWLDPDEWAKGADPVNIPALAGRPCYAGLDLAQKDDLSALVLVFPPEDADGRWTLLPYFFVPEDDIDRRSERDRVPYKIWREQGHLIATPGNVTDFRFIAHEIARIAHTYDLREIAYDRYLAEGLIQDVVEDSGVTAVEFGQGYKSMSGPSLKFGALIKSGKLHHGGHPVMTWCARNVVIVSDPAGLIKPDKSKSYERIDGVIAAIMGVGRGIVHEDSGRSIYETRGVLGA